MVSWSDKDHDYCSGKQSQWGPWDSWSSKTSRIHEIGTSCHIKAQWVFPNLCPIKTQLAIPGQYQKSNFNISVSKAPRTGLKKHEDCRVFAYGMKTVHGEGNLRDSCSSLKLPPTRKSFSPTKSLYLYQRLTITVTNFPDLNIWKVVEFQLITYHYYHYDICIISLIIQEHWNNYEGNR